ncbi:hypothetical protein B0H16DRAFT_1464700 [Mycena metata]|uniref:Uncharacterized protein n=1 Tax=Mycena metata TaxID=1033252 RepID=A0AAD7N1X4_9AGAR|nr:hypothetical protein B0H16DRAFT_1464700 [Mycena metata]
MDWSAELEELGRNSAQGKKNNEQTKVASTGRPGTYTRTRYHRIERALDSSAVVQKMRAAGEVEYNIYRDGTRKAEEVRLGFWEGREAEGLWEKQKRAEEGKWASTRRVGREACARGREGGRPEGSRGRAGTAGEGTSIIAAETETWCEDGIVYAVEGGSGGTSREAFPHLHKNSSGLDAGRRSVIDITAAWQTRRNWATHEIAFDAGVSNGGESSLVPDALLSRRQADCTGGRAQVLESGQSSRVEDGREGRVRVSTRSDQGYGAEKRRVRLQTMTREERDA